MAMNANGVARGDAAAKEARRAAYRIGVHYYRDEQGRPCAAVVWEHYKWAGRLPTRVELDREFARAQPALVQPPIDLETGMRRAGDGLPLFTVDTVSTMLRLMAYDVVMTTATRPSTYGQRYLQRMANVGGPDWRERFQ